MDMATRVRILNEAAFISHRANTLGKGMNPNILPQGMGKKYGGLGPLTLVRQPV